MKHHHSLVFFLGAVLLAVFIVSDKGDNVRAQSAPSQALKSMIYTMYHPIASDSGNQTVEGGELDRFGNKIVTASDVEEARARGDTSAGDINHPITLAADTAHTGEIYFIPRYTFTTLDENGVARTRTVTNFYGKVTDTGGAFKGRSEKIDIATSHVKSQTAANLEDRLPNNTNTVEFIPANPAAEEFARTHGTQTASTEAPKGAAEDTAPPLLKNSTATGNFSTGNFMWVTSPFCFKHSGSASPSLVAYAPTCNGGFTTIPPEPVPVPVADCGPGGILCTLPTGCLNFTCAAHNNAIWDPVSKTCGCG